MALGPNRPRPSRFYDGGTDDEPRDRAAEPRIVLERTADGAIERFRMQRRLAYDSEEYGELLVPRELDSFASDLASVPALFTWLVPRTGTHLPPALLHDGLVHGRGAPTYLSTEGYILDRVAADRVFRAAMLDSYTGPLRSWLIWSAATLGTIWRGSVAWSRARHLRYLLTAGLTLLVVAALGVIATLDLFDVVAWLPWMGDDRAFLTELVGGLAAAVVIPLVLGLAWGRFAVAGAATGIALAVLLHVSVALAAITLLYQVGEWIARRRPVAGLAATGAVLGACLLLTVLLVGTSG